MSALDFHATYSAATGEHIPGQYIPTAEHSDADDMTLDGIPSNLCDDWTALQGHRSGRMTGSVFHPSEYATDDQIRQWVRDAGGDVFALVPVEAPCTDTEPCFPDEPGYCQENGCSAAPAGWAVIYQMEEATA